MSTGTTRSYTGQTDSLSTRALGCIETLRSSGATLLTSPRPTTRSWRDGINTLFTPGNRNKGDVGDIVLGLKLYTAQEKNTQTQKG